jgi:hypothetical protein
MEDVMSWFRDGAIYMLNLDETMWRFYPNGRGPWAHRGADSVQLKIDGNERAGFTAVGICDYEGPVLLQFLGKGKTKASVRQFGDVSPHVTAFSESGWTTKVTLWKLIRHLRKMRPYNQTVLDAAGRRVWKKPIHLLMDCYKVHLDRQIRADADSMFQIKFHFIPAGLTDEWQPLDRAVFGVVKAASLP